MHSDTFNTMKEQTNELIYLLGMLGSVLINVYHVITKAGGIRQIIRDILGKKEQ